MEPTPNSQVPPVQPQPAVHTTITSTSTTVVSKRAPASPFIKFIRIFLLVLIVIGIVLLLTQNYWVPVLVAHILNRS